MERIAKNSVLSPLFNQQYPLPSFAAPLHLERRFFWYFSFAAERKVPKSKHQFIPLPRINSLSSHFSHLHSKKGVHKHALSITVRINRKIQYTLLSDRPILFHPLPNHRGNTQNSGRKNSIYKEFNEEVESRKN